MTTYREHKATIYLDIDGVIFPFDPALQKLPLRAAKPDVEDGGMFDDEYYHPAVVEALGGLAAKVVLASSRGSSFFLDPDYKDLNNQLGVTGSVPTHPFASGHILHKFRNVRDHWRGVHQAFSRSAHDDPSPVGTKAIWIDDLADMASYPELNDEPLAADPNFLIIQPMGTVGLTLDHIERMKAFIEG